MTLAFPSIRKCRKWIAQVALIVKLLHGLLSLWKAYFRTELDEAAMHKNCVPRCDSSAKTRLLLFSPSFFFFSLPFLLVFFVFSLSSFLLNARARAARLGINNALQQRSTTCAYVLLRQGPWMEAHCLHDASDPRRLQDISGHFRRIHWFPSIIWDFRISVKSVKISA